MSIKRDIAVTLSLVGILLFPFAAQANSSGCVRDHGRDANGNPNNRNNNGSDKNPLIKIRKTEKELCRARKNQQIKACEAELGRNLNDYAHSIGVLDCRKQAINDHGSC